MFDFIPRVNRLGKSPMARLTLAQIHFENGDHERAAAECKAALHLNPKLALGHLGLALIDKTFGRFNEAKGKALEALRHDPDLVEARTLVIEAMLELEQYEDAARQCHMVLEADPTNASAWLLMGDIQARTRKADDAVAAYKTAIECNPQMTMAYCNLATIFQEQGREQQAIEAIQIALMLNPLAPRYHLLLGDLHVRMGDYARAVIAYEEAVELSPLLPEAHFKAGEAYFMERRHLEALVRFRAALQQNPKYAAAHHRIGSLFQLMQKHELAIVQFSTALLHNPRLPTVHADWGDSLAALGRFEEATDYYCREVALTGLACPEGDRFRQEGQFSQAVQQYRLALNRPCDPLIFRPGSHSSLDERRLETRFLARLQVDLRDTQGEYIIAETVDASAGGFLLETEKKLNVGEELEIITRLNHDGQRIAVRGKIIRNDSSPSSVKQRLAVVLKKGNDLWRQFIPT